MPEPRISDSLLAALLRGTTPGPWTWDEQEGLILSIPPDATEAPCITECGAMTLDAQLIAAAPELALDLHEARERVAELRAELGRPLADHEPTRLTAGQVREREAETEAIEAERDALREQVALLKTIARRFGAGWIVAEGGEQWETFFDGAGIIFEPMEPRVADLLRELEQ